MMMKSIDELFENDEISVRTLNICGYNGLHNTQQIVGYFLKKYSFYDLRNCGRKSNEELLSIVEKYRNSDSNTNLFNQENEDKEVDFISKITSFSNLKLKVLENFLLNLIENADARCKNIFNVNFKNEKTLDKFLNYRNFKDLENAGTKTVSDMDVIRNKVIAYILEIENLEGNELKRHYNKSYLKSVFPKTDFPDEVLNSHSKLFVLDYFFRNAVIFNESEIEILNSNLKIFNVELTTLEETSKKLNLTRERVRQIRKKILETFEEKVDFIKNIIDDFFDVNNYELNYLITSDRNRIVINEKFGTNFTNQILTYIYYLNKPDFTIIGNIEDAFVERDFTKRESHQWKNIYLLKKEFIDEINLDELINFLFTKSKSRIEIDEKVPLENYIQSENTNNPFLISFLKKIVNEEFIFRIENNSIFIERNSRKNAYEYTYEALSLLGKPSTPEEIFKKIKELYPEYETIESGVRASMKRKFGFVPISRNGYFGLKEWEKTMEFKGGTLREIARNYLENFDEPKMIDDVLEYIQKYRSTNRNSLNSNLKLDESNTFIFFEKSFIGLNSKTYPENFKTLSEKTIIKKTWEESFEGLSNFTKINYRLPKNNSSIDDEEIIYRWLNVQKQKYLQNILELEKYDLLKNLILPFKTDFFKINKNKDLNKLLNYVIENQKLPFENEHLLDTFNELEMKYKDFKIDNNELKYFRKIKEIIS